VYVRGREKKTALALTQPPTHASTHTKHTQITLTNTCAVSGAGGRGRVVAQNAAPPMVLSFRESRAGISQRETGIGVDRDIRVLQAKATEAKKKLEEANAKAQHAEAVLVSAAHGDEKPPAQDGLVRGGRSSVAIDHGTFDHVAYHSNCKPSDHVAYHSNCTPSMVFSSRRFSAGQVGQWV
jgi:hypothetical protein